MVKFAAITMYPTTESSLFVRGEMGFDVTAVDCYAIDDATLEPFGVLVISSTVDQEHLARRRDVIRRFLDAGKVVVFGGHLHREWLPGTKPFEPVLPPRRANYQVTEIADHPIFAGVDPTELDTRRGVRGFFARGHHPVPEGAEVLVRLIGGQPVTYIDRHSTAGTIFVHATADLFSYASGLENTSASRVAPQLAQWAISEVEDLRERVPGRSAPVDVWAPLPASPTTATGRGLAAVYGGNSHHHRALTMPKYAEHLSGGMIYLPELAETDLTGYDGLIIPERIHRGHLKAAAPRILELLEAGGTVVALSGGEPFADFLPGISWSHRPTNYWWWLEEGADMGLTTPHPEHSFFEHLELGDCTWHYHGVVQPPEGAQPLVNLPTGETLLYVDEVTTPGTMVVATLDPMSHYGAYFMPATERFLDGFMPWIARFTADKAAEKQGVTA